MIGAAVTQHRHAVPRRRVPLVAAGHREVEQSAAASGDAVQQQGAGPSVALAERVDLVVVGVEAGQFVAQSGVVVGATRRRPPPSRCRAPWPSPWRSWRARRNPGRRAAVRSCGTHRPMNRRRRRGVGAAPGRRARRRVARARRPVGTATAPSGPQWRRIRDRPASPRTPHRSCCATASFRVSGTVRRVEDRDACRAATAAADAGLGTSRGSRRMRRRREPARPARRCARRRGASPRVARRRRPGQRRARAHRVSCGGRRLSGTPRSTQGRSACG